MKIDRRTQLREAAFLLLFRLDFYSRQDMPEQIKDFFEGEDAFTEEEKQAVANKVLAICELCRLEGKKNVARGSDDPASCLL